MNELAIISHVSTVGDLLMAAAKDCSSAESLVSSSERISYGALLVRVQRRCRGMLALGVRPGDRVGLMLPASIEQIELLLACATIGATAVIVNNRYRAGELHHVIVESGMRFLFSAGRLTDNLDFLERVREALPDLAGQTDGAELHLTSAPSLNRVILSGQSSLGGVTTMEAFDEAAELVDLEAVHRLRICVRLSDPVLLMYTSGTTSKPKGCLISHEAIVRNAQSYALRLGLSAASRIWSPLPMFHMGGLVNLFSSIVSASTFYIAHEQFNADSVLALLAKEEITVAQVHHAALLVDILDSTVLNATDISKLQIILSNPIGQTASIKRRLLEDFPNVFHASGYGMTEANAATITSIHDSRESSFRSHGRPVPGVQIKIILDDGTEAPTGAQGEILLRGTNLFSGYHNDVDATLAAFLDGWLRTGDLGAVNEFGELHFRGRKKDMLKVGGENVAAAEVESFLQQHPSIRLCQVVGAPDKRLTEVVAVFVELETGATITAEDIIAFCQGAMAAFKVPRHVRFVTEWPTAATGKILKAVLADDLARELETVA